MYPEYINSGEDSTNEGNSLKLGLLQQSPPPTTIYVYHEPSYYIFDDKKYCI